MHSISCNWSVVSSILCAILVLLSIKNSDAVDYTNEEYADIHYCNGLANGVSAEARRLYQQKYPLRQLPNERTFGAVHRRLRENGKFASNALVLWNMEEIQ